MTKINLNTTGSYQDIKNSSGDFGDFGDSGALPGAISIIAGYIDETGERWLRVKRGEREAVVRLASLIETGVTARKELLSAGIVVADDAVIRKFMPLVDAFQGYRPALVISRTGWHEYLFAYGDGSVVEPEGSYLDYIKALSPQLKFQCSSSTNAYWKIFSPLVRNQELLLFAAGTSFLAPVLEVVSKTKMAIQNPIFDWCGETTRGKSLVAICFAGSIFGWANRETGFGESWNTTSGGIEKLMRSHNGFPLLLDEANLADKDERKRGDLIALSAFSISNGYSRASLTANEPPVATKTVLTSTSNEPLPSYMVGSAERANATGVRFVTIEIPISRPFGVFTSLPEGFSNSADLANRLKECTRNHYGQPGRDFVQELVNARYQDESGLIEKLHRWFDKFMDAIKVNSLDHTQRRRAMPFALTYAAARLARSYGALPSQGEIGNLIKAYKLVWSMTSAKSDSSEKDSMGQTIVSDPISIVRNYYESNKKLFTVVKEPQELSKKEFREALGFIRRRKDGAKELVMSTSAFDRLGLNTKQIDSLVRKGVMVGEQSRPDNGRQIRLVDGVLVKDRVFVININILMAAPSR